MLPGCPSCCVGGYRGLSRYNSDCGLCDVCGVVVVDIEIEVEVIADRETLQLGWSEPVVKEMEGPRRRAEWARDTLDDIDRVTKNDIEYTRDVANHPGGIVMGCQRERWCLVGDSRRRRVTGRIACTSQR